MVARARRTVEAAVMSVMSRSHVRGNVFGCGEDEDGSVDAMFV